MSTTVRDASLITKRNRDKSLNAYYQGWKTATVTSSSPNAALKAPTGAGAEVVAQIKLGCEACNVLNNAYTVPDPDPNQTLYPFNPSSGGASRNGPS